MLEDRIACYYQAMGFNTVFNISGYGIQYSIQYINKRDTSNFLMLTFLLRKSVETCSLLERQDIYII